MEKVEYRAIHKKSNIEHTTSRVTIILHRCIISPSKEGTNNGSYREFG